MKYLIYQILILVASVAMMLYFINLDYFLPTDISGNTNTYNVFAMLLLIFMLIESFISTVVFLVQKFLAFGWREFPPIWSSLKIGVVVAITVVSIAILNISGIANAFLIGFLIVIAIISIIII